MEQRSDEWFQARAGRITASRMCDVMAYSEVGDGVYKSGPRKGQPRVSVPLKARTDYAHQLAAERLTGIAKSSVRAGPLEWGKEWEPVALREYENTTGVLTRPVAFILHPDHNFIGASADFLVDPDGGGEIKCPFDQESHLATWQDGMPLEHVQQVQGNLMVSGRQWWDFVSYHPAFPDHLRLYIQRIKRDEAYIARLLNECVLLNAEVQSIVSKLMKEAA